MSEIIDRGTMEIQITSPAGKRLFVKDKVIPKNIDVVPNLINLSVAANGKYTPAKGYTGFNEVDVQVLGGEGGTVVPLTALANEEYTTAYTYQYDTIRIDANTVTDIITDSDGSETPVLKLSGWLPETLSKGTIANLGIILRTKDADGVETEQLAYGGEDSMSVEGIASPEDTGISGVWASDEQSLLCFIQDATSLNATLGTDYFENNSIYMLGSMLNVLIQYIQLGYIQYYEWVVPINGTKIENVSFNPVTVNVYVPPTSDEQLEITGPEAGSTVYHQDDGTYYNQIKVTSLPTQTVDVELKETSQTITANSGYVLKQVNVPASTIPDGYVKPDGTLTLTENGDYDVTYYKQVNVNISASGSANLTSQSVTVEQNGTVTITPPEGYDGFSSLELNVNVQPVTVSSVNDLSSLSAYDGMIAIIGG